jgi:hypothetical protein
MNNGIPNTPEKLDCCFIVKAATNSALALQMAQKIWTDPEQAGYELADLVQIINTVSIKLRNYCQMVNHCAHNDKPKEEDL